MDSFIWISSYFTTKSVFIHIRFVFTHLNIIRITITVTIIIMQINFIIIIQRGGKLLLLRLLKVHTFIVIALRFRLEIAHRVRKYIITISRLGLITIGSKYIRSSLKTSYFSWLLEYIGRIFLRCLKILISLGEELVRHLLRGLTFILTLLLEFLNIL